MRAYAEAYLSDVVENQGKLLDLLATACPQKIQDLLFTH